MGLVFPVLSQKVNHSVLIVNCVRTKLSVTERKNGRADIIY